MNKRSLYILTLLLSLAGYGWLSWNFVERSETPTLCLVKHVTGIPCPSCGTTTAMIELLRGNILSSLYVNPFGILMAAALFVFPGWILSDLLRKRESFFTFYQWLEAFINQRYWVSAPAIFIVVINWMWNISKGL